VNKPQKPQLQKSLGDRKRKFEEALRRKTAALLEPQDGTIYAGFSPDNRKQMYAMPADAPLSMTFNEAVEYAKTANSQKARGHNDWRVPTKNELNVLFDNRAAIGGFDESGFDPAGWYWSATSNHHWATWAQKFSDGFQGLHFEGLHASVRLVR
jgi:Protein of unknown function (DUF1566)